MKRILSDDQIQDLVTLHNIASRSEALVVIIGAVALACFLNDLGRFTADVDLVIPLDLRDFGAFSAMLAAAGWRQESQREHRWRSPRESIIDVLPAGPELRAAKYLTWPNSQFTMSLVGFDHVFVHARPVAFGPDIIFNVAPLAVIALLKIVAHIDDPQRRAKDLRDLQLLMMHYEAGNDRIFTDEVFAAELEDIDQANAFLLGRDVSQITTHDERIIVRTFTDKYRNDELTLDPLDDREEMRFQRQLRAFAKGIGE